MTTDEEPAPAGEWDPPSRRTMFAEERTLLAWWRTGIASAAVALAVGGLIPRLGDLPKGRFLALACGYGLLSLFFVIGGTIRGHRVTRAMANNGFSRLAEWGVIAVAAYTSVLVILTVVALL